MEGKLPERVILNKLAFVEGVLDYWAEQPRTPGNEVDYSVVLGVMPNIEEGS